MAIIGLLIADGIASMPGNVRNAYLLIEHQIVRRFSLAQEAQRKAMKRNADNKGYAPLTAPPFEKGGRKLSNKFAVAARQTIICQHKNAEKRDLFGVFC